MSLSQPLNDGEMDELEDFLSSDIVTERCMDIAMLHGFLTSLISSPSLALPSQWLRVVWGAKKGPQFESFDEAQRILGLIMRLYTSIGDTLEHAPKKFLPIVYRQETTEGKLEFSAEEWCRGYTIGTQFCKEDWEPLLNDKQHLILMVPILAFTSKNTMEEIQASSKEGKASPERLMAQIPMAVAAIYDYWRPRRKELVGMIKEDPIPAGHTAKVGRNEPCPCGSGKKFKKCCGARAH